MTISIEKNHSEVRNNLADDSDKIIWALMDGNDPVGKIIQLYDKAESKRNFALAMSAVLLMRHRQWQALSGQSNR